MSQSLNLLGFCLEEPEGEKKRITRPKQAA